MSTLTLPEIAGLAAGLVGFLVGHIWYVYTIIRGQTTAHFLTWALSAFMSGITLFFYTEAGAQDSVYVVWSDLGGFTLISIVAWKYRHEGFKLLTLEHGLIVVSALVAFVIYLLTGNAFVSLVAVIVAEAFTLFPTIKKTLKHPDQEEFIAWTGTISGNTLNIFAIHGICSASLAEINVTELVYVLSILVLDGIVWGLILREKLRRR